MNRHTLTLALVAIWAVLVALSIWQLTTLAPTGDGFTRGLNRVTAFLGWQAAAALVALAAWRAGRGVRAGTGLHWLSRVPLLLALALAGGIAALILWARLSKPAPVGPADPPAKPATQPVDAG